MSDVSEDDFAALKDQVARLTENAVDSKTEREDLKSQMSDLRAQVGELERQQRAVTDFLGQLTMWWQSIVIPSSIALRPLPLILPPMPDPPR
jgi:septal ring factor EnvC (AmiA/AmiB activator)